MELCRRWRTRDRVTAPAAELASERLLRPRNRGTAKYCVPRVKDGSLAGRDATSRLAQADPDQIAVRRTDSAVNLPVGPQLDQAIDRPVRGLAA